MARDFNKQWIHEYGRSVARVIIEVKKQATLEVWRNLQISTPVDTGRARAGWLATARRPSSFVPPEGQYNGPSSPSTTGTNLKSPNYVVNNVEYVPYIDESHPNSAGFVEEAVDRALARLPAHLKRHIRRHERDL